MKSSDSPIFLISAGWRTGSTLLQRMMLPQCMVWGEPYGQAHLLNALANPERHWQAGWPPGDHFYDGAPLEGLSRQFIANLYPPLESLKAARHAFFDQLFGIPALKAGAQRWGLKTVRLDGDDASFLKSVFPLAKLIFLLRNPYDAYRSYLAKVASGQPWYHRWPDRPLDALEIGRHWRNAVASFIRVADQLEALVVQYETLAEQLDEIEGYVGIRLNRDALRWRPKETEAGLSVIPSQDLRLLHQQVHDVAELLEYGPNKEERCMCLPAPNVTGASSLLDPARCVVLVPVGGEIEPRCEVGLVQLEQRGYTVRRIRGYSAIDQGRNQLATDAINDGFEETFWIDSDIEFDPDDVEKLRGHNLPVSCGIYPKKGKRALACHVLPGTESITFGVDGGLVEIQYAGAGFLHVRREVYEVLCSQLELPVCNLRWGRQMIPFFQPLVSQTEQGGWYLAEDYAFCERVRRCGFRVFADSSIRLSHIGKYGFSWEEAGMETKRYGNYVYKLL